MSDYGITGFGAYVPRLRIDRAAIAAAHKWMAPGLRGLAKGERAFASWDEDSITMAVEAARNTLPASDRSAVSKVTMASTTFPYADLQNCSIVTGALALSPSAQARDVGGTQSAGLAALADALIEARDDQLVVSADRLRAKPASPLELTYGAGAAALRLGERNVLARLVGAGAVTAQFVDHFRASDTAHDYFWEERWIRDEGYSKLIPEAVNKALEAAGRAIGEITTLVMAAPLKGAAALVGRKIGFTGNVADDLSSQVGYCGTAHSLLMLVGVLETAKPGDLILTLAFGQGAQAILLEVTDAVSSYQSERSLSSVLSDKLVTDSYTRLASFYEEIELEWGMRAEKGGNKAALSTAYRHADQLSAFIGGRCRACGTVQFPQLAYCVNPDCNAPAEQFEPYALTEEACQVLTFTADWLSYYPAPPMYVGFVQFDVGARLLMEMVDVEEGKLDVGTRLRTVFRIKEPDKTRGFNRYFWKATPIAEES